MYIKQFNEWNVVKQRIETEVRAVTLRKAEIRWASIGVNVGAEIDGKGTGFTRPVLILRVIGSQLALVVPLSTKLRDIPGYIQIELKGTKVSLCANHIKMVSQKRIFERTGKLPQHKFETIREQVFEFLK